MNQSQHSKLLLLIFGAAYVLSACSGTLPQDINSNEALSTLSAIASSTPVLPETSAPAASLTPQVGGGTEVEIFGVVESMTETTVTVNGVTYNIVTGLTEFKDVISVGDQVKIHIIVNADGTFTIREIERSTSDDNASANSNDDNGNDSNSNDDNGNEANSNDDNSNNANSNDDNGNDNNDNNDNNDDSGGSGSGGNGNDDKGGNDNGGNDNG